MADVDETVSVGCAGFIVGAAISAIIGWRVFVEAREEWCKDAVEHHAGRYVIVDPNSGTIKFEWIDKDQEDEQ